MTTLPNHYQVLGVLPTATQDDIKKAYRQQIQQIHPDRLENLRAKYQESKHKKRLRNLEIQIEDAKAQSQKLNEAYAVLSNPEKREAYDRALYQQEFLAEQPPAPEEEWIAPHATRPRHTTKNPDYLQHTAIFVAVFVLFFICFFIVGGLALNSLYASTNTFGLGLRNGRGDLANAATFNPDSMWLGDIYFDDGLYNQAIKEYTQAIDSYPEYALAHYKRAEVYRTLSGLHEDENDFQAQAIADYNFAIVYRNNFADAYLGLGLVHYQLWQQDGIVASRNNALQNFEDYVQLMGNDTVIDEAILTIIAELHNQP